MPFSLPTLVAMTMKLKEVSLGLVELAFPDSRPSVKDQYRSAVGLDYSVNADTVMWSHLFKVSTVFTNVVKYQLISKILIPLTHLNCK